MEMTPSYTLSFLKLVSLSPHCCYSNHDETGLLTSTECLFLPRMDLFSKLQQVIFLAPNHPFTTALSHKEELITGFNGLPFAGLLQRIP